MQSLSLSDLASLKRVSSQYDAMFDSNELETKARELIQREEGQIDNAALQRIGIVNVEGTSASYPASSLLMLQHHLLADGRGRYTHTRTSLDVSGGELVNVMFNAHGQLSLRTLADDGVHESVRLMDGSSKEIALPQGWRHISSIKNQFCLNISKSYVGEHENRRPVMNEDTGRIGVYVSAPSSDASLIQTPLAVAPENAEKCLAGVSNNGKFVVSYDRDAGRLSLYDAENDSLVQLNHNSGNLTAISVSNSGEVFLSDYGSHVVFAPTGAKLSEQSCRGNDSFQLSPDGRFLVRGSQDNVNDMMLRDMRDGNEMAINRSAPVADRGIIQQPQSIAFSPLNGLLAVAYYDRAVEVFDLLSRNPGTQRSVLTTSIASQTRGFPGEVSVGFSNRPDTLMAFQLDENNRGVLDTFTLGSGSR